MNRLYLYAVFHANLSFSSIPKKKYPTVIDRSYWPLLELIKEGHKVGLELPSSTLRTIQEIDSSFVRELTTLWQEGKCEVIGSGFTQNIFPLIPYEVNRENLRTGLRDYETILGKRPTMAFINEQTYSGGLPSLYRDAGFDAIIMDWDNATEFHGYPPELRYRPVLAAGVDGTTIPVVWNSSLNSYKFQRCIYDRMSIEQYLDEVLNHLPFDEARALPLYGTDLEMFNYRPVTQEETTGEMKKVASVFSHLREHERIMFVNPSEVLHYFAPIDKVSIESPESPLPCKNRDDYNVVRWAVSGRDDVWFNTECYKIYNKMNTNALLSGKDISSEQWEDLNTLWGSDLRTKTTSEKHYGGKKKIGEVSGKLDGVFADLSAKMTVEKDFILLNPHDDIWNGDPYELEFHFVEGSFYEPVGIALNGKPLVSQCENIAYYRDGSIRSMHIVCCPVLGPLEVAQGSFVDAAEPARSTETITQLKDGITVATQEVVIDIARSTGGDVRNLTFPSIFGASLMGYLSPVYYDHVGHSNDYYSMGIHLINEAKLSVNDTKVAEIKLLQPEGQCPIRIPVSCKIPIDRGILWKTYYVYQHLPRVDVNYTFYLNNVSPTAFRLGIMTLNPQSFAKEYLKFSTTNGTPHVENFYVQNKKFHHHEPIGTSSSCRACVGATEGWIDVSDGNKGLAMLTNKSQLYSVPMVEYEEIKQTYLLRVHHSLSESDETGQIHWRGHNTISFSLLGHHNKIADVRKAARHKNKKLLCVFKQGQTERSASDPSVKQVIKNVGTYTHV